MQSSITSPPPSPPLDDDPEGEIADLRKELDRLDRRIVDLLAHRLRLARRIGRRKRELRLPLLDPGREAAVIRRAGARARDEGLAEEPVRHIFWKVVGLSRSAQQEDRG